MASWVGVAGKGTNDAALLESIPRLDLKGPPGVGLGNRAMAWSAGVINWMRPSGCSAGAADLDEAVEVFTSCGRASSDCSPNARQRCRGGRDARVTAIAGWVVDTLGVNRWLGRRLSTGLCGWEGRERECR
jgi:hypothetical protein